MKRKILTAIVAAAIVAVIVTVSALYISTHPASSQFQFQEKREITIPDIVQLRIETDKAIYSVGEPVKFRLFQKNLATVPIQRGILSYTRDILNSAGDVEYSIGANYILDSNDKISSLEESEFPLTPWPQIGKEGKQVEPGTYTVKIKARYADQQMGSYTLQFELQVTIQG